MPVLTFDRGSLLLRGAATDLVADLRTALPAAREDGRVEAVRVPAHHYHLVVRLLVARGVEFEDEARQYKVLELDQETEHAPRPYQEEAVRAWRQAGRRGLVILPTGSGKTFVADLAIRETARSTLVVVPTLDLLNQWFDLLANRHGEQRVGAIGGGAFEPRPLTVITYDSAYLHTERLGARFGLLILDEVHHLTGTSYCQGATMSLAPYRLGLSATPPESGEGLEAIERVVGPIVYRREITELSGDYLSSYETVRVKVQLAPAERQAYDEAHHRYRSFVHTRGLRLGGPHGWGRFLQASSQSEEGRAALAAWREQRRISQATPGKLDELERILERHPGQRMIVFTHNNDCAYDVSLRFLVPTITHQTKPRERREILKGLEDGTTPVVVTSRVLNEGVNVPSVSVGVVLSGSATVREHVQRLGRILRKQDGKHAVLYEVITEGTSEEAASQRRRKHDAYR